MSIPLLEMAEQHTILRAEVGSTLSGLNISQASDRDEMGICVEPMQYVVGFNEFEQVVYRSAQERSGNSSEPSKQGDLDLTIYSLRKWLRLALKGNPTILTMLFIPQDKLTISTEIGLNLQALAPFIVSKACGGAFLGYLQAQRQRFTGERGGRHGVMRDDGAGYDTKYAMHMLRLGFQGVEILSTGRISLPCDATTQAYLLDVRKGLHSSQDVLTRAGELEREIKDLMDTSHLPARPDSGAVEAWMIQTYRKEWA